MAAAATSSFVPSAITSDLASSASTPFSTSGIALDAKVFYALALDKPTPLGVATNHPVFFDDVKYLDEDLFPSIVLRVEGYNLPDDFSPEDFSKCSRLLQLINLRAGEPDSDMAPNERNDRFTDAYAWMLMNTSPRFVSAKVARKFETFLLEFTGFQSVSAMREFIDIVFAPRELLECLKVNPDLNLLEFDGLRSNSPSVKSFITRAVRNLHKRMTNALKSGNHLGFEDAIILLHNLTSDFMPDDSSRPISIREFSQPWVM